MEGGDEAISASSMRADKITAIIALFVINNVPSSNRVNVLSETASLLLSELMKSVCRVGGGAVNIVGLPTQKVGRPWLLPVPTPMPGVITNSQPRCLHCLK